MLSENLMTHRKNNGITQEELAIRLNVVRQTVSKWEKGQSVPDADILIKIADIFDVSVSELLGTELINEKEIGDIAQQLSRINEQLAIINRRSRRIWKTIAIGAGVIVIIILFMLVIFTPVFNLDQSVTTLQVEYDHIQESIPIPASVQIPDFKNKNFNELINDFRYTDVFIFVSTEEYSKHFVEGYIISQNPIAGIEVPLIPIDDYVSDGTSFFEYEQVIIELVVSKGSEPTQYKTEDYIDADTKTSIVIQESDLTHAEAVSHLGRSFRLPNVHTNKLSTPTFQLTYDFDTGESLPHIINIVYYRSGFNILIRNISEPELFIYDKYGNYEADVVNMIIAGVDIIKIIANDYTRYLWEHNDLLYEIFQRDSQINPVLRLSNEQVNDVIRSMIE